LFTDWKAAEPIVTTAMCASLANQRFEKRGAGTDPSPIAAFDTCPPIADIALWPSGEDSRPWGIRWSAAPYVAGPWSEGIYGDYLSVPDALLPLIKPQYRAPFALPVER
ncbi:MAG: hypothetical protein ACRC1J_06560, partial [Sandaracinobacteroides sp.]